MRPRHVRLALPLLFALGFALTAAAADDAKAAAAAGEKIKTLLIDGQNNHAWQKTTPLIRAALESSGRFAVDVVTAPGKGKPMDDFKPDFAKYAVVVSNYNGDEWPEPTKRAFEEYVKNGGGFVPVHAANNAFPKWAEYNKMIGVGGWGGRTQAAGPMLRFRDGRIVRDDKPGGRGGHGKQHAFAVDTRAPDHPVMQGLPARWMHAQDELYGTLGGPAEHVTVLATAFSDKSTGGTGEHEPMLLAIDYGKGRVFHTTLGHAEPAMKDVGFVVTLCRGAEWAATGKVTQPVPANFPTADKVVTWEPK